MLVKLLMDMVKALILLIISLFPTLPDMSNLVSLIEPLVQLFVNIDSFVSVQLVGTCLGLLFVFSNAELIWSIIMWVIKKIPGVS